METKGLITINIFFLGLFHEFSWTTFSPILSSYWLAKFKVSADRLSNV
jgi:hypothetical protein